MKKIKTKSKDSIYAEYRKILEMPHLSKKQIDVMRDNLKALAVAICEHVWNKKFY
jgi:hypothetical protein